MKNTNRTITNTIRNTSCSKGWLKQLNQILFGTITVLSFALLMLMVLREAIANNQEPECEGCYPCVFNHCSVVCANTNLQLNTNSRLTMMFKETDENCQGRGITLRMNNPIFEYGRLPDYWLTEHTLNISSLEITGGNLRNITPTAFESKSFNRLQILTFQAITITQLIPETFLGLHALTELNIRSTILLEIQENVLQPMGGTLRTLQITDSSGVNPRNLTGSLYLKNLTVVDLTYNDLNNKLNKQSFRGLQSCRLLYLSSSRITSIRLGTFDYLENIERLDLSNNLLKTLPGRLFDRIIAHSTELIFKLDLHENPWHCICDIDRIIMLFRKNILMVDPLCNSPNEYNNQPFSTIYSLCNETDKFEQINKTRTTTPNIVKFLQLGENILTTEVSTDLIENVTLAYVDTTSISADLMTVTSNSIQILDSLYINTLCNEEDALKLFEIQCTSEATLEFMLRYNNVTNDTTSTTMVEAIWKSLQLRIEVNNDFENFNLIWFQTLCPTDIYCLSEDIFKLYNNDYQKVYCAVEKSSRTIKSENCITFMAVFLDYEQNTKGITWLIFTISILTCMAVSSLLVFFTVRNHPTLLKGSKRVLLVHHRVAQALVLPPQFTKASLLRRDSCRSVVSGTPSYISALQPTEDQLASWRISRLTYLDPSMTMTSISRSEKSPNIYDMEAFHCDELRNVDLMGSNI